MLTELLPFDIDLPTSKTPRSPGVHVSSVIKAIAVQNGTLKISDDRLEKLSLVERSNEQWWSSLKQEDRLRICIGLAWEEWYIPRIGDVTDHPGELCVDNIYLSPDGESSDIILTDHGERPVRALHEVKATYKSVKTVGNLSTQYLWLAQTKAYCKAMETCIAYLHVLFLCGDYSWPQRPRLGPDERQASVWRITYTQAEIDANWDDITDYVENQQRAEAHAQRSR